MLKFSARHLLFCISLLSLNACDNIDKLTHFNDEPQTKDAQKRIETGVSESLNPKDIRRQDDVFMVTNDVWVGGQTMRLSRGKPLPPGFDGPNGIILSLAKSADLSTIANTITDVTKIPVRIDDTVEGSKSGKGGGSTTGASDLNIAYEGPLAGLLDQVSAHFGLSWSYDGSGINFFKFETRTFTVEALPGTLALSDEFSGADSGGSGGGSSSITQSNSSTIDIGYWAELTTALEALVGENGDVTTAESIGSVTVTTTPDRMRKVAQFMNDQNTRLSRQVAINVEVFSVTLTDSEAYGLNIGDTFKDAGDVASGGLNATTNITGSGVGAGVVPNFPVSDAGQISITLLGKHWSLTAVARALSRLGNVTTVARAPITTLNNRAASRKITTDKAYVASITSNVSGTSGTTSTSITPATVSDGLTLQVLPRILDDGRILLQYSLKLSTLQSITSFSTAAAGSTTPNTVQTPEVSNKAFLQQAMMQSGSTLVIAGFDQDRKNGDTAGIGSAYNWFLGGGVNTSHERQMLVIAITPREVTPSRGISPL